MRSSLAFLWTRTSGRARAMLVGAMVLAATARVAALLAAVSVTGGAHANALRLGLMASAAFAGQRILVAGARLDVEVDLYRATVRGVLGSDVLDVETGPSSRVVFEGMHRAIEVLTASTVSLLGDGATLLVAIPVLASTLPAQSLVLVVAGGALALGMVLVARRWSRGGEAKLTALYDDVCEELIAAVEARAEIVAHGLDPDFARRFEALSASYRAMGKRVAVSAAVLGRAPLVAFVLGIGLAFVASAGGSALRFDRWGEGVILALAVPPFVGFVVALHTAVRSSILVRPFVAVLEREPRASGRNGTPEKLELSGPVIVDQVTFRYGDAQAPVLEDVSLRWEPGQPLVLTGPNGSGKTTLLRLLLGLRRPSSGSITVAGHEVARLSPDTLRRHVAYLPQRPHLGQPQATVERAFRLLVPDAPPEAMSAALDRIGLQVGGARGAALLALRVGELSAGQRQRVALARVFVQEATMVFLDEPDANLDAAAVVTLAAWIRARAAAGGMVVLTAHSPELAKLGPCFTLRAPAAAAATAASGPTSRSEA